MNVGNNLHFKLLYKLVSYLNRRASVREYTTQEADYTRGYEEAPTNEEAGGQHRDRCLSQI